MSNRDIMNNRIMAQVIEHSKGSGISPVPSSGGAISGDSSGDIRRRVYHMHKAQPVDHSSGGAVKSNPAVDDLIKRYMRA